MIDTDTASDTTRNVVPPVRGLRLERGWTLLKLAVLAGCSPSTVCAAERGYLPGRLANRLAHALGVDPLDLRVPGTETAMRARASGSGGATSGAQLSDT